MPINYIYIFNYQVQRIFLLYLNKQTKTAEFISIEKVEEAQDQLAPPFEKNKPVLSTNESKFE